MKLSIYGKGGIGKSTVASHLSVALARRGERVLQIGCDPKHDSTFTLTGFLIPTIIDTLQRKDYHYEEIWPEDVIYQGFSGVDCVEAGGPPAGAGCGGYVVGETVKLLKELNAFYEYTILLFDVIGDVVCGGFAAPLNYSDYCLIITDQATDSFFAANRILRSVREKARNHPLRLFGVVANRIGRPEELCTKSALLQQFQKYTPFSIVQRLPNLTWFPKLRTAGKTVFEARLNQKTKGIWQQELYLAQQFLWLADELLAQPEGVVRQDLDEKLFFQRFSTFGL